MSDRITPHRSPPSNYAHRLVSGAGATLNPVLLLSATAVIVGLLFATATLFISTAPNTPGLRVFSASCLLGALYAGTNVTLQSGSVPVAKAGLTVALLFAALHGSSWYVFVAHRERRSLVWWERLIVAGGVGWGLLSLVPGLLYHHEDTWIHEVRWAHVRYIDMRSTALGDLAFLYFAASMGLLLIRSLRRYRETSRAERAEIVGLGILLVMGINDSFVSSGYLEMPYLLDIGFLALVIMVASGLALQYVDNARALQTAQDELVRRERLAALGEMSAVVAHEVRNPVAIIFNAVGQLRKRPEEREKLLGIVEDEAERLKRMVSDLLEFARPTHVVLAVADLPQIVQGAGLAVRGEHEGEPVALELELSDCPPRLECDERLVRQALVNLMTNALQASPRDARVEVTVTASDAEVAITVADHGPGIPDALESKIFTPFFTTRPTGTGLGLPVVQRIAEAHGGTLSHRPTPGGGATFELRLPRARRAAAPA